MHVAAHGCASPIKSHRPAVRCGKDMRPGLHIWSAYGRRAVANRRLQRNAGTSRLTQLALLAVISAAILGLVFVADAWRLASPTRLGDLRRAVLDYPALLGRSRARVDL